MRKLFGFVVIALALAGCSQEGGPAGVVDGKLAPCPDTPNCVNSEYPDQTEHYINPITFKRLEVLEVRKKLKEVVQATGGSVTKDDVDYVTATYVSDVFKFVDDVEFRFDLLAGKIHVRSASRTGYSDLGVNRDRVEAIRQRM